MPRDETVCNPTFGTRVGGSPGSLSPRFDRPTSARRRQPVPSVIDVAPAATGSYRVGIDYPRLPPPAAC